MQYNVIMSTPKQHKFNTRGVIARSKANESKKRKRARDSALAKQLQAASNSTSAQIQADNAKREKAKKTRNNTK